MGQVDVGIKFRLLSVKSEIPPLVFYNRLFWDPFCPERIKRSANKTLNLF